MRYSTLLFDLDDTLLDFHYGESESLQALHLTHFAEYIDVNMFISEYRHINSALWQKVASGECQPQEIKHLRFKKLLDTYHLPHDHLHIASLYELYLGQSARWLTHAKESLTLLKQTHRIGIITNGLTSVQMAKYACAGLAPLCDTFIISEQEGISKPNPAIFQIAFQRLQCTAHNCLMIGDSLEHDYQGALNTSMDFCWVNTRKKSLGNYPSPAFIVDRIDQLYDLLISQK